MICCEIPSLLASTVGFVILFSMKLFLIYIFLVNNRTFSLYVASKIAHIFSLVITSALVIVNAMPLRTTCSNCSANAYLWINIFLFVIGFANKIPIIFLFIVEKYKERKYFKLFVSENMQRQI